MIKMKPMLEKNQMYYCEECKNIMDFGNQNELDRQAGIRPDLSF